MSILGEAPPGLQGIYVDLDSLFDTRLATLEFISQELAIQNAENNWAQRESDLPLHIDKEVYNQAWKLRNKDILRISMQTGCISAIRNWINQAAATAKDSPAPVYLHLYINVWPYSLSQAQARLIGEGISKQIGDMIDVTMVNLSCAALTPRVANTYFSCMFMYDWRTWLDKQAELKNFDKTKIPSVTLYAPRIFLDRLPNEEDEERMKETRMGFFEETEFLASRLIGLEFIESLFFNALIPPNIRDIIGKVNNLAEKEA